MSDIERRELARKAGDGDLEAAMRLVWMLEKEGRQAVRVTSPWTEATLSRDRAAGADFFQKVVREEIKTDLPNLYFGNYVINNLAALLVTCCDVEEIRRAANNGDWFGMWPMALANLGADPERANRTPAEMSEDIRKAFATRNRANG